MLNYYNETLQSIKEIFDAPTIWPIHEEITNKLLFNCHLSVSGAHQMLLIK